MGIRIIGGLIMVRYIIKEQYEEKSGIEIPEWNFKAEIYHNNILLLEKPNERILKFLEKIAPKNELHIIIKPCENCKNHVSETTYIELGSIIKHVCYNCYKENLKFERETQFTKRFFY